MSEEHILRELTDDGVLVLTLNRPETMNALSNPIREGIKNACRETKTNDAIRVIVITGNGRGFCSGADVGGGGPVRSEDGLRSRSQRANKLGSGDLAESMFESDVPIIGAINGAAAGAGFGLALCCDVRIASDQARLGSVFIRRGVGPDFGTSFWLPRIVGQAKAYELLYSGELLNAEAALAVGLVNRVVAHDTLIDETMTYARTIAAGPPIAFTYTRRAAARSFNNTIRDHLEFEMTQQMELMATKDAHEGFSAFRERRAPEFTGH
jgi:2-(1,2-epoxy-1,2-dihydrophenyl)acetyl-CoA isomerase